MNLSELIELATTGKLFIEKRHFRDGIRQVPIYASKKWEVGNEDFYKITGYKKVKYKVFTYSARTSKMPEGTYYKLWASNYKLLKRMGAIEI